MIDESNLIFIISQPRAGSTLTQKLLSNNNRVDTVSEPWLLLPLLSVFKPDIITAKYNYPVALKAFFDYLKKRDLQDKFSEGLKELLLSLYSVKTNGQYFIDKTPRYYEILPEIMQLFPQAKFLILKRHPLASLYSMMTTWSSGKVNLKVIQGFKRDFLKAPFLIQEFSDKYKENSNVREVKYEDIVNDPKSVVKKLYDWLGIEFSDESLEIKDNIKVSGIYGDDVYRDKPLETIVAQKPDWQSKVNDDIELAQFFSEYQEYLSIDFTKSYGYDKVNFKSRRFTFGKSKFKKLITQE